MEEAIKDLLNELDDLSIEEMMTSFKKTLAEETQEKRIERLEKLANTLYIYIVTYHWMN